MPPLPQGGGGFMYFACVKVTITCKGVVLDSPAGNQAVTFYVQSEAPDQIGAIRGSATYSIKLPKTRRNQAFFAAIDQPDRPVGQMVDFPALFDPLDYNPAVLEIDGNAVFVGQLRFIGDGGTTYDCQMVAQNADWIAQAKGRKLGDVNRGNSDYDFRWVHFHTICTLLSTMQWFGKGDVYSSDPADFQALSFGVVEYNADVDLLLATAGTGLSVERYFRPHVFIWPLLRAHFQEMGWKLQSNFFTEIHVAAGSSTYEIDPLIIPFTLPNEILFPYIEDLNTLGDNPMPDTPLSIAEMVSVGTQTLALLSTYALEFDTEVKDTNGWVTGATISGAGFIDNPGTYNALIAPFCRLYFVCRVFGTFANADAFTLSVVNTTTNANAGNIFSTTFGAASNPAGAGSYQFEGFVNWSASTGANFALMATRTGLLGGSMTAGSFLRYWHETGEFDLRDNMPNMGLTDLCKGLTQMFNLRWNTNQAERIVTVEPYTDTVQARGPDITAIVDRPSLSWKPLSASLAASLVWGYKEDGKDILIPEAQSEADELGYAAYELVNPDATTTGEARYEPPFASSADSPQSGTTAIFRRIQLYKDDTGVYSTDFGVRIAMAVYVLIFSGNTEYNYYIPVEGCITGFDYGFALSTDPDDTGSVVSNDYQATHFNTGALSTPATTDFDPARSLAFNDIRGHVGLWERFWASQFTGIEDQRLYKFRVALAQMSMQQLLDLTQKYPCWGHWLLFTKVQITTNAPFAEIEATLNDYVQ